jgi:hypothetical protein
MSSMEQRLDKLGKAIEELARTAQEKIEYAVEVGSKKIDLLSLRRSVDRELVALGQAALTAIRAGKAEALTGDPAVAAVVERLNGFEAEIQRIEAQIEAARRRSGPGTPGSNPQNSSVGN